MLLENNTKKVIDLIDKFDKLNDKDKIRLAIYIMENKSFNTTFNVRDIIILLKEVMDILDDSYLKTIVNFSKYEKLLLLSSKYFELSENEKKCFTVEMLFNIYENDFNNKIINAEINNNLLIYDYCYSVIN